MVFLRPRQDSFQQLHSPTDCDCDQMRRRLFKWQEVRTWARLIREAESLWRVDERELRRLGALELTQLHCEIPKTHRDRINRWLGSYSALTRLEVEDICKSVANIEKQ